MVKVYFAHISFVVNKRSLVKGVKFPCKHFSLNTGKNYVSSPLLRSAVSIVSQNIKKRSDTTGGENNEF